MIRVICFLLFSLFASNVCSQIHIFKVLGYSGYNLMNDHKWTDYVPEKNTVYVYYDLDNQEIRISDLTTNQSSVYKCWDVTDPFIKKTERNYTIKATQIIGDLVLHELIQFVFDDNSIQLYITFGNSITMWELEFIEKIDSPSNNLKQSNKENQRKVLKKNPNFEIN